MHVLLQHLVAPEIESKMVGPSIHKHFNGGIALKVAMQDLQMRGRKRAGGSGRFNLELWV